MYIIKRLFIISSLIGILMLSIAFIMAKKGINCYADRVSNMALPSEAELVQYLENCKDITANRILPLLSQIQSKQAAQLALPSLTEACRGICSSYAQSIDASSSPCRDLFDTFKEIKKLSALENQSIKNNIPLLHQLYREYNRLRQADFYENPQLRNLLTTYVADETPLQYGLECFRWNLSYPIRLFLSLHAPAEQNANLLQFAELTQSETIKEVTRSYAPFYERYGWNFIPDYEACEAVVETHNTQTAGMLDVYMMDPQTGLTNGALGTQAFYSPNFPDYLITNGIVYSGTLLSPERELSRQFVRSAPQLDIPLENVRITNLAGWHKKDALSHSRMVPFESCCDSLPDFYKYIKNDFVVLKLQQPCASRFLVLLFDQDEVCYAYMIEK